MCFVAGSSRRIFSAWNAADARQIDVHQDHIREMGACQRDAEIAIVRAQHAYMRVVLDDLLDQHQVGWIVFHIEQGAQSRAYPGLAVRVGRVTLVPAASCGITSRISSIQNSLPTPTRAFTPMVPPINSTSCLVTTRPMPVPSSAPFSCPRRLNG